MIKLDGILDTAIGQGKEILITGNLNANLLTRKAAIGEYFDNRWAEVKVPLTPKLVFSYAKCWHKF